MSSVLKVSASLRARCSTVLFRCPMLLSLLWKKINKSFFELISLRWSSSALCVWMWKALRLSVQRVLLKRAYKIWCTELDKHRNVVPGKASSSPKVSTLGCMCVHATGKIRGSRHVSDMVYGPLVWHTVAFQSSIIGEFCHGAKLELPMDTIKDTHPQTCTHTRIHTPNPSANKGYHNTNIV